jgi:hypothetical protein
MDVHAQAELDQLLATLATHEDVRAEAERLRRHITLLMERQTRSIHALIDAIQLMKYIDSEGR